MIRDLTSARRPLSELRQHPANPRNGDVDAIAESLTLNGQYRPIVTTADGTILAGNHTYQAALSLGWDDIAAVVVDVEPDSPAAHRIMLADNRTADRGNYDDGLLLDLLRELDATDVGLQGSGYDDDDLAKLASLIATNFDPETDVARLDEMEPTTLTCPACGHQWQKE